MKTDWKLLRNLLDYKPSKASKAVFLNSNYNGRSVQITLKDKMIIELDSDQTPNYQWIPSENSLNHFSQIKVNYRSLNADQNLPKRKVSRITLGPQKKGKGVVTLHYLKPEDPERIIQTFKVNYEITGLGELAPSNNTSRKIISFLKTHLL